MRKIVAGLSAVALGLGVALVGPGAHAQDGRARAADEGLVERAAGSAAPNEIVWKRCENPLPKNLECGSLSVPLDHADPWGKQITIAVSRKKHTVPASAYKGILLVNPGGPGGAGLGLATVFEKTAAAKAAAAYDVIGFDPRGVGASRPRVRCTPEHRKALPDPVPANARQEEFWLKRAKQIARACEKSFGWMLPHMRTEDSARDMDIIRAALGREQLSFFGYSWGTRLGMTYATLFPNRVDRMVLDSVVHPTQTLYETNLAQNTAFQKRMADFFAWMAKHRSRFRLGSTADEVEATYYRIRSRLKAKPISGAIGPWELDDLFSNAAYSDGFWPPLAGALKQMNDGETVGLELMWNLLHAEDASTGNDVYLATGCSDSPWPRRWSTWRRDARALHRAAPFFTWGNTWLNAPCAFWPVEDRQPLEPSGDDLPPILIVQSTKDAATPYPGALAAHRLLPSSRLVLEKNGGNHAISLSGNKCLDRHVANYLATGALPPDRPGPDATCAPSPAPKPAAA